MSNTYKDRLEEKKQRKPKEPKRPPSCPIYDPYVGNDDYPEPEDDDDGLLNRNRALS